MEYDVTITRTGGIIVDAESADEALEKVNEMSVEEIEAHAQLTCWETSDATLLNDEPDNA